MIVIHEDSDQRVSLADVFYGWSQVATPLKRNESGIWTTEIVVPGAGLLEYKFIVDGQRWMEDPSNGLKALNNYGGLNSVIVIN